MKKAVKITIERYEGRSHECGKPQTFEGETCWKQANAMLGAWSRTAPKTGGYDKCGFTVEWEDGETYEGRYDLTGNEWPSIERHMRQFLEFHAGTYCPAHLTEQRYRQYLATLTEHGSKPEDYAKFLAEYEIGTPRKTPQVSYLEAMGVL